MEPLLKNRTRFTSSLENKLSQALDDLTRVTRIPKSRLLDEAVEDLLLKYSDYQTPNKPQ